MTTFAEDQLDHMAELVGLASAAGLSVMTDAEQGTMTVVDPKDGFAQVWYPKTWGQARRMLRRSVRAMAVESKPAPAP